VPITRDPAPLQVSEIGSFHLGGEIVTLTGLPIRSRSSTPGGPVYKVDPNGDIGVGQMYVQFVRLATPRAPFPLLLWHGGGMTGATWETTPDGRPGWQMFFLRAGFDVFVSDAVERGRSGFAPFPEVYPEAPFYRTAKEAWEKTFRLGPPGSYATNPKDRHPFPNCRFPVEAFDLFMKQAVPRWSCNDGLTQAAYDALVAKLGPCILMMHSQGGNFGLHAALGAPGKVKAVIAIEPSGAPDPAHSDPRSLTGVPHLFVWGDNVAGNDFWEKYKPQSRRWYEALVAAGVPAEWVELSECGIVGNSHALMMDDNSDEIAAIILDWLERAAVTRVPGR
jgi:pimeloyl-ACP methyl ester carboxylesterase